MQNKCPICPEFSLWTLSVQRPSSCSFDFMSLFCLTLSIFVSLWFRKDTLHKKSCMSGLSNFYSESVKKLHSSYLSKSHGTHQRSCPSLYICLHSSFSLCLTLESIFVLMYYLSVTWCFLHNVSQAVWFRLQQVCWFVSTGVCDGNDASATPEEKCKSPTSGKDGLILSPSYLLVKQKLLRALIDGRLWWDDWQTLKGTIHPNMLLS